MWPLSIRQLYFLTFLACVSLLGTAYYLEIVLFLEPCPLCIMQRIAVLLIALTALAAAVHNPKGTVGKTLYAIMTLFGSALGVYLASRHIYIQSLPPGDVPTCLPGLELHDMVEQWPLAEVITLLFKGDGKCAEMLWSFLGLSMPQWTLIWFVGFAGFSLWLIYQARFKR